MLVTAVAQTLWSYTVSGFTRAEDRSSRVWRCWDPPGHPALLPAGLRVACVQARRKSHHLKFGGDELGGCLTGWSAAISRKSGGSIAAYAAHCSLARCGDYVGGAQ